MAEAPQYQIQVRLLDGRTRCLQFPSPTLVTGRHTISPTTTLLAASPSNHFPSASTLLRLRGSKGGFGSLLRGRDINDRRLRHINGERRLEEWERGERLGWLA
jgi:hypothetical protein